jgi:IPT/TIG domain
MSRRPRNSVQRSLAVRLSAALLVCGLAGAFPSLAAADNTALIGVKPAVENLGPCRLEASGAPGEHESESALDIHGPGIVDDGTITRWSFIGTAGGNGTVSLDIFEPGFATHPVIEKQIASPYDGFQDETVYVTERIPVIAGQGIGVTVSAGPDSETQANVASVLCAGEAVFIPGSFLALWESPLTVGQHLAPSREGAGEVSVGASVEYDAPVVESVSPESGPAAGGTEVTIRGKHLANASVGFPEEATKVPAQTPTTEDTEVKVITEEAVTGAPAEGVLYTYAGSSKFKYTYIGTPRSRTPQIVLEPVTNITQTSAQLNATVNIEGLLADPFGGCSFGYGAYEVEEESLDCEPVPTAFSEIAEPVSAQLTELTPGTTYHYFVDVGTKYAERSGFAETNDEASFKTLGTGEGSGKEKSTEPGKEPAKELSATLPAPTITPAPLPVTLPKGLMATVPDVGLLGGSSLTATPTGVVPIKVSCPAGESSCIGTITLKTIGAVSASAGHEAKKAVLTLATGSFKLAGGKTAKISLHLSVKARALLKRSHSLRARATILAHDSTGARHTTVATVTLRAAKKKH